MSRTASKPGNADGLLPRLEETLLWKIKLRLQFTGWLQYMPFALATLACLLLAAVGGAIGHWPLLYQVPLSLGLLCGSILTFDVLTVKLRLRPPEPIPPRRDGIDPFDLMRSRVSCRSFQTRDLTAAHRAELMAQVQQHTRPEALLGDRPIRLEYIAAPLTVWPVVGAHEFLVAIAPKTYSRMAVIDVGRSLQQIVLHATRMGLATCWIGPGADQKSIVQHLGARFNPETDHVICVCAVGYASWFKPTTLRLIQVLQHTRQPLSSLFFADPQLQTPLDVSAPPFAAFGRCYEVCQWAPSSYNSQTTRCMAVLAPDGQLERFDFFAATSSRYYAAVALGIWCASWQTGCAALGIRGHFAVPSPGERADTAPRVDLSWVLER